MDQQYPISNSITEYIIYGPIYQKRLRYNPLNLKSTKLLYTIFSQFTFRIYNHHQIKTLMGNMSASLVMYLIISLVLGYFIGRNRQIGFGWSVFFLLFGNILFGLPVVFLSKKNGSGPYLPSKLKVFIGGALITIFSIVLILHLIVISKGNIKFAVGLPLDIWFIGLGLYLIRLGKCTPTTNGIDL